MVGRKLTRDANARLGGVCAGVARYFGIDPIVARILVVAGALLTGGLLGAKLLELGAQKDAAEESLETLYAEWETLAE